MNNIELFDKLSSDHLTFYASPYLHFMLNKYTFATVKIPTEKNKYLTKYLSVTNKTLEETFKNKTKPEVHDLIEYLDRIKNDLENIEEIHLAGEAIVYFMFYNIVLEENLNDVLIFTKYLQNNVVNNKVLNYIYFQYVLGLKPDTMEMLRHKIKRIIMTPSSNFPIDITNYASLNKTYINPFKEIRGVTYRVPKENNYTNIIFPSELFEKKQELIERLFPRKIIQDMLSKLYGSTNISIFITYSFALPTLIKTILLLNADNIESLYHIITGELNSILYKIYADVLSNYNLDRDALDNLAFNYGIDEGYQDVLPISYYFDVNADIYVLKNYRNYFDNIAKILRRYGIETYTEIINKVHVPEEYSKKYSIVFEDLSSKKTSEIAASPYLYKEFKDTVDIVELIRDKLRIEKSQDIGKIVDNLLYIESIVDSNTHTHSTLYNMYYKNIIKFYEINHRSLQVTKYLDTLNSINGILKHSTVKARKSKLELLTLSTLFGYPVKSVYDKMNIQDLGIFYLDKLDKILLELINKDKKPLARIIVEGILKLSKYNSDIPTYIINLRHTYNRYIYKYLFPTMITEDFIKVINMLGKTKEYNNNIESTISKLL